MSEAQSITVDPSVYEALEDGRLDPQVIEDLLDPRFVEHLQGHDVYGEAVYAASGQAECLMLEEGIDIETHVPVHEVQDYMGRAIVAGGWEADTLPEVVFDVPHDSERVGWVTWPDRVIHLDPDLTTPPILLHELAHWLGGPLDKHGPQFAARLISLVWGTLGDLAARLLLREFDTHDVPYDTYSIYIPGTSYADLVAIPWLDLGTEGITDG